MKLLAENVGKQEFHLQRYCIDENHGRPLGGRCYFYSNYLIMFHLD
jgi:hypothetical protein